MKTQKRTLWVLLALMQAAVLILLILQIVELAPRRWKLNENVSITTISENGQMTGAPLEFYESAFEHDYGKTHADGARYVNEYTLSSQTEWISEQYVRSNGFVSDMKAEKLCSSANDFAYTLSGAENNSKWQVWISFGADEVPYIAVVETGDETK